MNQQQAQAVNYRIATQWYRGFGLTYEGLELGRILEYEMLRVIGHVLKPVIKESEPVNVDGHAAE